MATTGNNKLNFPGLLTEKENVYVVITGQVLKQRFHFSAKANTLCNKPRFSLLTASAQNSHQRVATFNRTKANGVQAAEGAATAGKLPNGKCSGCSSWYQLAWKVRGGQEAALNHVTSSGIGGSGYGATREMSLGKLIWVVTRVQVQVQRYSSWGDVIEIVTWVDAAGKNGMRRDWIIRDHYTKEIITRATSTWVIMNRVTRRQCKIPQEVKLEVIPFYLNRFAIASEQTDCEKIDKLTDDTAERIRSGLAPRWNDMDANKHVSNVKYIGWILESVPIKVLEEYNLTSMTLEYRRECRQSNLLESLTSPTARLMGASNNKSINRKPDLQYTPASSASP